ncbi:hypothetical protein GTP38_06705 [Duganella sp. FT94W]|uniref:Uncharacterized protein n=1 Tax=Duganella lactea TaxID=2692173 RepID=A0ABW9V5Q2_9BURK|nr:hypothetical protein [Duganella lactea]MYM34028.1 hypothetical protein [Duganella lactea]
MDFVLFSLLLSTAFLCFLLLSSALRIAEESRRKQKKAEESRRKQEEIEEKAERNPHATDTPATSAYGAGNVTMTARQSMTLRQTVRRQRHSPMAMARMQPARPVHTAIILDQLAAAAARTFHGTCHTSPHYRQEVVIGNRLPLHLGPPQMR